MRKNQNYKFCKIDIGGGKDYNNNKNKKVTNLADFVKKYLDFQKNKVDTKNVPKEINKEKITKNTNNTNFGNNIKKTNILLPTIQKWENFTISGNDLFQNLNNYSNNNIDESFRENNVLLMSFSKNFNVDLHLKKGIL